MNLFNEKELNKIVDAQFKDGNMEEFIYNFISINKEFILEKIAKFTIDDLWYSQYYWLNILKQKYNKKNEYDAGINQQQFKLLEVMMESGISIDWNIIKSIEQDNN